MTICYLDPEDEITGAVARIRAVDDNEAIVVLPPGSRIATSRINFRLLSREAEEKGLTLVAVSDEPGVRALAISAGVPAYDSVAGAEAGLAEFARQDRQLADRIAPRAAGATGAAPVAGLAREIESTRVMATPRAPARSPDRSPDRPTEGPPARSTERRRNLERTAEHSPERGPATPRRRQPAVPIAQEPVDDAAAAEPLLRSRRRRQRSLAAPLIAIVLLLALVGVAAYGAYLFVPTATITLRPQLSQVGPVSGTITADPRVAVVDPNEGVIPAQQIELPLSTSGEFAATGTRVSSTRASGTVVFTSHNTAQPVSVPAGTRIATGNGVAFETTSAVTIPRAVFGGAAGEAEAPIRAVRAGPRGNVGAGAISVIRDELGELVFVTNPQPTSGGERRETRVVTGDDYAAALASLSDRLAAQLQAAVADPANTPRGLTLYPDSAMLGESTADPAAGALVDSATQGFTLTLTASASVLAVNEGLVDDVALEQLRALVPPGATLVAETVVVSHTPGGVSSGAVVFTASANGSAYRVPERDVLLAEVRGQPIAEAREIMSRYGSVELTVWPDFVDRVPDQLARVNLIIVPPTETP